MLATSARLALLVPADALRRRLFHQRPVSCLIFHILHSHCLCNLLKLIALLVPALATQPILALG